MESLKKIYTKTGDEGTTSLKGGLRVAKTDIRIEVNGAIDETNSAIGLVRAFMESKNEFQQLLREIQISLMKVMSAIASIHLIENNSFPDLDVDGLEREIDEITSKISEDGYFVLPGGTKLSALMHYARVCVRKSERLLWSLNGLYPLPEQVFQYFNRLSDLFFVMARYELQQSDINEERWKIFSTRRK